MGVQIPLNLIDKASSLDDSYTVHLNRGDILAQLRRYDEADVEYRRAVELRPDLSEVRAQTETRLQHLRNIGAIR